MLSTKNKSRFMSVLVILALVFGHANVIPASAAAPYALIDLGTLGGSFSAAVQINEAGQVVGYSSPAGTNNNHAFFWEDGVMTDLGTLGGSESEALEINDMGQVIGWSYLAGNSTSYHAFFWEDGLMTDLGTLGGSFSHAGAINNAGQVVGFSYLANGSPHAFLWESGVMADLGTLGGNHSEAFDINEAGQVVGSAYLAGNNSFHAFLWKDGVMIDLGTLGGSFSEARAINEAGQITGWSSLAGMDSNHAFFWEDGVMTDLGTLGGSYSYPVAINNVGQVFGYSYLAGNVGVHAFFWENGEMIDLGTLGGSESNPTAINEAGQLVGFSDRANGSFHAFLWEDGVMTDLGTLGGSLSRAYAINEAGQIVGYSSLADGSFHAFVATSVNNQNQPPTVSAGGPYAVNEGGSASVTASGTDPEGGLLTFAWDLDNNGSFETPGQSVTFSAAALDGPSTHTIKVQVVDTSGLMATNQTTVDVLNVPPTANLTVSPEAIQEGESAILSFSNSFDPSAADIAAGFLYSYDCTNNGTFELADSPLASYTCTYPTTGTFTALGRIADKEGGFTDYLVELEVLVDLLPPDGTVDESPVVVNEGEIAINGGTYSSEDPEDDVMITASVGTVIKTGTSDGEWIWSYGTTDGPDESQAVTINLEDGHGNALGMVFDLTVNNVLPEIHIDANPTIAEGEIFSGSGFFTDPGNDSWTGSVDYGDGSGEQPLTLHADKSFDLSHLYSTAGEYNANIMITDDGGGASLSFTVTVGGTKIAFISNRDGNSEIYVMNADGSDQTRLTNNSAIEDYITWSPDGTRIAFASWRDGNGEIYVMNADGSNQVRLTYDPAKDYYPSWSPDGTQIAFITDRPGAPELRAVNADGSNLRVLADRAWYWGFPDWSPDGGQVAFSSNRDGNLEIYLVNADGSNSSNPIRLTESASDELDPAWSPDGTQVAVTSYWDTTFNIAMINVDDTGFTYLTNGWEEVEPFWSPEGTQIAFTSWRDGNDEIYVMNPDGTSQTRLTSNTAGSANPSWSPDGKYIVFNSLRDGNNEIYMMNADGTGQTRLTNSPNTDWYPVWQPLSSTPDNIPPIGIAQNTSVVVDEGEVARNDGIYFDFNSEDNVVITASLGTVTQTGTSEGDWSWSLPTTDGPDETSVVTIAFDDGHEVFPPQATFELVVLNVPPTADMTISSQAIKEGESATLLFSNSFDPSVADTDAGFLFSYDCTNDGVFEVAYSAFISYDCEYPTAGTFTALGRITDKDEGFTDYVIELQVLANNLPPDGTVDNDVVEVNEGETAINSGIYFDPDPEDNVVITASLGTLNKTGTNSGNWSWSYFTSDGPDETNVVTIALDDGNEAFVQAADFALFVNNVAPTATFTSAPSALLANQSATLAFSNPFDPGLADTNAGFRYSYDCTNDGVYELADSSLVSYACVYPAAGTFTAFGRIADKDGGFTDYTAMVTVRTPQEEIEDLIQQVEALVPGSLNRGQGNALIVKLQAAIQQLNSGKNIPTAIHQLEAFINDVSADISSGKLTLAQGQPLLDAANEIIAALGG